MNIRRFKQLAHIVGDVVCETLWPTRCALCDMPGEVLCERCADNLPFIDQWQACPVCGAAYGLQQCDFCNSVMLDRIGRTEFSFSGCASATVFGAETGQIVRVFKDQGEQRLAMDMARIMCRVLPHAWKLSAVTFVPASLSAYRYRGFDHGELLAQAVAQELGLECLALFARPRTRDQRKLGALQRIQNLSKSFRISASIPACSGILLVDDVMTTGSTLCAATDALKADSTTPVYALTFARV